MSALYLGHFSGLRLQRGILRDELMSPLGQRVGTLTACYKMLGSPSSVSLSRDVNPVCIKHASASLCVALWDLGIWGTEANMLMFILLAVL